MNWCYDRKNDNRLELWGGIECTINRVQNVFFDQLQYSQHYNRPGDIDLLAGTGIKKLRYPVLGKNTNRKKTV